MRALRVSVSSTYGDTNKLLAKSGADLPISILSRLRNTQCFFFFINSLPAHLTFLRAIQSVCLRALKAVVSKDGCESATEI